jgi:hypothetical protein
VNAREFACVAENRLDEGSLFDSCSIDRVEWLSADSHWRALPRNHPDNTQVWRAMPAATRGGGIISEQL